MADEEEIDYEALEVRVRSSMVLQGPPKVDPACVNDPIKWQRGRVFHSVGRKE